MMQTDAAAIAVGCAAGARRKAHLHTLETLDGRTVAARRANELAGVFEADMGAAGKTAGGRMAARRAAVLVAIAEDTAARRLAGEADVSVDDVVRADGAASRAIRALDIKPTATIETLRASMIPTLGELLQRRSKAAPP
jgi:hypothetical protein